MFPLILAISLPIELVFLAFHISVGYFILVRMIRKDAALSSAFFVLYLLQTMADVGNYFTALYMQRLAPYGLVPFDYRPSSFEGALTYFFSGYFSYYQFIAHCAIAFNRYTIMLRPTAHSKIWDGVCFKVVIIAIFLLPLLCAAIRLTFEIRIADNDNGGYGMFNLNTSLSLANGMIATSTSLLTCTVSCFLEYRTFYAFRKMSAKHKREHKEDYRLLLYAMLGFLAHLLMAVEYVFVYLVGSLPAVLLTAFPYIIDLLCLCGSVCLLFTRFYGLAWGKSIDTSSFSTTRVVQQRPTLAASVAK